MKRDDEFPRLAPKESGQPHNSGRSWWFRRWLKRRLPARLTIYLWRLVRWAEILREIRGDGPREEAKLILSGLAGVVTALRGLGEWRTPVLLLDVRVRVRGSDRFHCRRFSDDLWHVLPSVEIAVRDALRDRLGPGGVFVDAGANIGVLTVLGARLVGRDGHTLAIEMVPETARALRRNLAANGLDAVQVVEAALSDKAGERVVASIPDGFSGHASIVPARARRDGLEEVPVTTTTLDAVTFDLPGLDVLKLDLEGAESLALDGGRETLERTRCVIFEERGHGHGISERLSMLGFRVERLDSYNLIAVRQGAPAP